MFSGWYDTKLTKAQRKDQERLAAWVNRQPFKENSKAKPAVPELEDEQVMEMYIPPAVKASGQFYTPFITSSTLYGTCAVRLDAGQKVLDPCAGIGHLFYNLRYWLHPEVQVDAYEIEEEAVALGSRLFPWVNWNWNIPFDCLPAIEGQYDLVIMNPPFGAIRRGMTSADVMSGGKAKLAEHLFMELAIRALKPDGVLLMIAPGNLLDRLPKTFQQYVDDRLVCEWCGPLPGEFKMTNIRVSGFYFTRHPDPVYVPTKRDLQLMYSGTQLTLGV